MVKLLRIMLLLAMAAVCAFPTRAFAQAPPAPTGLIAALGNSSTAGFNRITLNWDVVPGATSYTVKTQHGYRRPLHDDSDRRHHQLLRGFQRGR